MNQPHASLALAAALLSYIATTAHAGVILQPVGASTNMASANLLTLTINQSGLSATYTSLVTDFDTYVPATKHNGIAANKWFANSGTGNVDFDLGGTFTIESFALWNSGNGFAENVVGFSLLADDDPSFGSPTLLGDFTANPNAGPFPATPAEIFTFTPTQASFVRMSITSSNNPRASGFGEVAFEVQSAPTAVPEPASLVMLASALGAGAVVACWRRRGGRDPGATLILSPNPTARR